MAVITKLSDLTSVGFAKEAVFGTYVAPTDFLPVHDVSPSIQTQAVLLQLMRNNRAGYTQSLPGIQHKTLDLVSPLFPDAGNKILVQALGADQGTAGQTAGNGITGTPASALTMTPISTTSTATITAGDGTLTLTSATGFASNQVIVIEPGTVKAETFLITLAGSTVTFVEGDGGGAVARFTHTGSVTVAVIGAWSTGALTTASTGVPILAGMGAHFATGDVIQIDYNSGTSTSSECHTLSGVSTDTLNFTDATCDFAHAQHMAVFKVGSIYNHTILPVATQPTSLSFDVNMNGLDLEFTGSVVGKAALKLAVNADAMISYALHSQQVAVNGSPPAATWPTDTAFGPTGLTIAFGSVPTIDTTASTVEWDLDNGTKVYDTLAGAAYPTSIVSIERKIPIKTTLFFQSLSGGLSAQDYFTSLGGGTTFKGQIVATQGSNVITITHPALVISPNYKPMVKKAEIVTLDLELETTLQGVTSGNDFTVTIASTRLRPY